MALKSKLAGGLAATALVLAAASPANARGYPNRWHRDNDRVDAGAVFGVLLGVGIIAAIASSAAKKKEADNRRYEDPRYDPRVDDRGYDNRSYDDRGYDGRATDNRAYDSGQAGNASQDRAVDACAIAARDEASRGGGFAEVGGITSVQAYGGGWNVTGTIDERSSFSSSDRRARSFGCIWDNGRVSNVVFGQSV